MRNRRHGERPIAVACLCRCRNTCSYWTGRVGSCDRANEALCQSLLRRFWSGWICLLNFGCWLLNNSGSVDRQTELPLLRGSTPLYPPQFQNLFRDRPEKRLHKTVDSEVVDVFRSCFLFGWPRFTIAGNSLSPRRWGSPRSERQLRSYITAAPTPPLFSLARLRRASEKRGGYLVSL